MCCWVRGKLGQIKNSITDEHKHTHTDTCTCTHECTNTDTHLPSLNTHTSVTGSCSQYFWVLNMATLTTLLSLKNTLKLGSNLQLGFRIWSQLFVLLSVSHSSGIFSSRFTMFYPSDFILTSQHEIGIDEHVIKHNSVLSDGGKGTMISLLVRVPH